MFVLLVQVEVRPEMLGEFEAAILENAARSLERDRGCVRFDVSHVEGDTTRWLLHEVYDDEAAWERHRQSPHFLAYKAVADRALTSRLATRCVGRHVGGHIGP